MRIHKRSISSNTEEYGANKNKPQLPRELLAQREGANDGNSQIESIVRGAEAESTRIIASASQTSSCPQVPSPKVSSPPISSGCGHQVFASVWALPAPLCLLPFPQCRRRRHRPPPPVALRATPARHRRPRPLPYPSSKLSRRTSSPPFWSSPFPVPLNGIRALQRSTSRYHVIPHDR